jgi:hypothetical protein
MKALTRSCKHEKVEAGNVSNWQAESNRLEEKLITVGVNKVKKIGVLTKSLS